MNADILPATLAALRLAQLCETPVSLTLPRNLHGQHACKFHATSAHEDLILQVADDSGCLRYVWICLAIHTLSNCYWAEEGSGDILFLETHATFQQALKACLDTIAIDNELVDAKAPVPRPFGCLTP